jgi:hypothetical protein
MKRYFIEVVIEERLDEFWEEITANGKTGCDELLNVINEELQNYSPVSIVMKKFEEKT